MRDDAGIEALWCAVIMQAREDYIKHGYHSQLGRSAYKFAQMLEKTEGYDAGTIIGAWQRERDKMKGEGHGHKKTRNDFIPRTGRV